MHSNFIQKATTAALALAILGSTLLGPLKANAETYAQYHARIVAQQRAANERRLDAIRAREAQEMRLDAIRSRNLEEQRIDASRSRALERNRVTASRSRAIEQERILASRRAYAAYHARQVIAQRRAYCARVPRPHGC
ncbi:MAG: hypothetical protein DLM50_03985 [Candidatus Meridianibacter frigidus]|nr:MAG: hypothetical protein DLM50_03985 [Candidatus Eremiobacteraeota bacterium]